MTELAFASIATITHALKTGAVSYTEYISSCIDRFKQFDGKIGSALEIFDQHTLPQNVTLSGPLSGIPGLLKDNICQQGRIASCGSKILQGYRAPYDATVSVRLRQSEAPLLGRANMDEFAMGGSTETSAYQLTRNPWNLSCVPGGSSGGSIAAVAAGLVPWALGSETGGSVRQPANFCGIVGLKPTYGLISRYGLIAYASSLDQIGIATRTVHDNALVLSAIAGHDPLDSTSVQIKAKDYTQSLSGKLPEGFRLAVVDNALNTEGYDPEIKKALQEVLEEFKRLGAQIKHVTLPMMDHAAAVYFMVSRAEAASNLARFDGVRYGYRSPQSDSLEHLYTNSRNEGFGFEVKSRILVGNYVLSVGHADAFYTSAKKVQAAIRQEFIDSFKECDLLFMPGHAMPAFKFGAFEKSSLAMDLQDYFTAAANLAGIPALAIPCGFTSGNMPIGFQLFGPDLSEELLFQVAHAYEQVTPWHTKHPDLAAL